MNIINVLELFLNISKYHSLISSIWVTMRVIDELQRLVERV